MQLRAAWIRPACKEQARQALPSPCSPACMLLVRCSGISSSDRKECGRLHATLQAIHSRMHASSHLCKAQVTPAIMHGVHHLQSSCLPGARWLVGVAEACHLNQRLEVVAWLLVTECLLPAALFAAVALRGKVRSCTLH